MRNFYKIVLLALVVATIAPAKAGNPDRVGQSGGMELLIDPWPRSSGWHGAYTSGVSGVEALRHNVAGLIDIHETEFLFGRTSYMRGSGVNINSFGFAQTLGEANSNAIGVSVMSMDYGEIEQTTVNQPSGGLGTYSPNFVNIGAAFTKKFSQSIRGGAVFRVISESIPDVSATGVALDAGIQYVTDITGQGQDRSRLGIALRNVGTPMKYSGNGLTYRSTIQGNDYAQTLQMRSKSFELPSLLNIGISQDFYPGDTTIHKLTVAANFTSNSFIRDQFQLGLQYGFKDFVQVRAGYNYEDGMLEDEGGRKPLYAGPSAGISFNIPFSKVTKEETDFEKHFGIDYSFRMTNKYQGVHTLGGRLNF